MGQGWGEWGGKKHQKKENSGTKTQMEKKKPHKPQLKKQNDFSTILRRELHILVQGKKKKIGDNWGRKTQWGNDGKIWGMQ